MSVERRREVFLQQLDLSSLEGWSEANQEATHTLLAEYHDIFFLEPRELGCTDLANMKSELLMMNPLKSSSKGFPPSMMDEVWAHMKEMLETGTIHLSQSPRCKAVMFLCKKDGGLHFCIDFHKPNARTKKDSYLLPQIQEAIESLVGVGIFSYLDLKEGFWQIAMDEALKQYNAFTVGNLGFFKCEHMPFWLCNALAMFQRLMQNCLGELNLTYCLICLDDVIVFSKMEEEHLQDLHVVFNCFWEHNLKLKPTKCKFFLDKINYLAHHISKEGMLPSKENLKAVPEFALPLTYMEI